MDNGIYEFLLKELEEDKALIDRKRILIGFLSNEIEKNKFDKETQNEILNVMSSIVLVAKEQLEIDKYEKNILYQIELAKNEVIL